MSSMMPKVQKLMAKGINRGNPLVRDAFCCIGHAEVIKRGDGASR